MSGTRKPRDGSATSLQMDLFPQVMWTNAAYPTCRRKICADTLNATSSLGSADGPTPSRLPDGLPTAPSGPDRARASRSRSQDAAQAPVTQGTYGPTCFASSVPPGPLSSWESRLRDRLAMAGSTEFPLIWKDQVTPAGRSISRLAPSMRRTSATGCTGALWPTPTLCGDYNRKGASATSGDGLRTVMMAAWSTPRASDGEKGGLNQSFGAGGTPLPAQMHTAAWSTPTTNDARNNAAPSQFERNSAALNVQMAAASGTITPSSPATTVRRGVPNPQFPCWLMGFPAVWLLGAASAMPSSRRSPPK